MPTVWAGRYGLGVGSRVTLSTGRQVHEYAVVGLLKSDALAGRPTAWPPLRTMQSAFETPSAATAILIRLQPGRSADTARGRIQDELGALYVVASAAGGGARSASLFDRINLALPLAGFIVLLGGAFLVFNAFAIMLAERRHEIGQLRILG